MWWVWRLLKLSGAVFGQKLLHKMWSVCGHIVVVQDPVTIPPFFQLFSVSPEPTDIPHSSAICRTVSLLLLRMIVLTLAIISSLFNGDSRPERGLLSAEVLPSLNRWNQSNTCVQPIASSPYACCNNWYVSVAVFFQILKQNLMQMRCSVLSHIVKITMT